MSYQVIARKYRPQRFADVVGQEHVTQTLSHAIQQNRIAHAYLFVGPRGTGKTTLARIFAKCLNCTDGPSVEFKDDDPRCQEIAEGRSLDVLEIDGASNRGIEEVRELRETVKYAPATARFKIYIIDEVHMLTKEAFNALLKTLEEPPAHVKFMFATTEPDKVLPTILSRCQRFDLRRIPSALIVRQLARIAELEKVSIDEPALHAIARGAEGGMRDAQSALDQLISFCGDKIVEEDVLSMFGLTARGQVFSLARSILAGESQAALRELDDLAKKGKDLARLISDLLNHFRNLLLFQVSGGDLSLLDGSEPELAAIREQAQGTSADVLTRILELLSEYEGRFRDAPSKRILLEVAILNAIQARSAVPIDTVLEKLQALRAEVAGQSSAPSGASKPQGVGASTAPASSAAQTTRPEAVAKPAASTRDTTPTQPSPITAGRSFGGLAEIWTQILEGIGSSSPFARTYLLNAHPVSLVRNVLTIGFPSEFADHIGLVDNQKNRTLIQSKLEELGIGDAQVKFVQAERPDDWNPTPAQTPEPPIASAKPSVAQAPPQASEPKAAEPAVFSKEEFKNDPLIKQALEIFKGQIVNIPIINS